VNTLTHIEQRCLYRLSVFQGNFSYASAQAVAHATSAVIDTLLNKSLLQRAQYEDTTGNPTQENFGLHPLIRQYAAEMLVSSPAEKEQTEACYYHYYAGFLGNGMAQWREASYAQSKIVPLSREIENIRAAARWLLYHGSAHQRKGYMQHLWDLYRIERRLPEVIELLNEAIQLTRQTIPDVDAAILAQWQRMLGEAYHILGEFEASRRHFEETLSVLNFPRTHGTVELLTTLHRQGIQQVLNRLGGMKLFAQVSAARDVEPGIGEAIEAYRQLVDISLFSGDVIRLVNGALYALNLAERAGTSSEQAVTYSLMCMMMGAVPLAKPGPLYERLTLEKLPMVQEPERQIDIAIYLSAYYAGRGNWSQLDSIVQPAIEKSRQYHLYRRWGYCQAIWASTFGYRGHFAAGLQVWGDLYDRSLSSDSFLFILPAWAAAGMALCAVRSGQWQRGLELAEQGLSHLQGKDDAIGLARTYAAIALAQALLGEVQPALTAADQAIALVENRWPTNYASLECYAWAAEVYLLLWQRSMQQPLAAHHSESRLLDENGLPVTTKQLKLRTYKAWKALQKYAQVFPIGHPGECLIRGKYAWISGRATEAYAAWRKGIEVATRLEMRYELGCAHLHLAHALHKDAPQRAAHLRSAETILADNFYPRM
jgi:tetratricopeptide (TPR) repeat protein